MTTPDPAATTTTTPPADTPSGDNPSLLGTDTPPADATPADPNADPKAADPKPADPPAEITYDFKTKDGVEFDSPSLEKFTAIAKEHKLPADVAQKFVDLASEMELARAAEHGETVKGWLNTVKSDKDLGGDKLPESLAVAKKTFDLLPKEQATELKTLLTQTGLEAHPAVFRLFHAVGKALSEDTFVQGGKPPAPKGDAASRLYHTTANQPA